MDASDHSIMLGADRIGDVIRECMLAMRVADDAYTLSTASTRLLFQTGACLTRGIVVADRARSLGIEIASSSKFSAARQKIMNEIRRRAVANARPPGRVES